MAKRSSRGNAPKAAAGDRVEVRELKDPEHHYIAQETVHPGGRVGETSRTLLCDGKRVPLIQEVIAEIEKEMRNIISHPPQSAAISLDNQGNPPLLEMPKKPEQRLDVGGVFGGGEGGSAFGGGVQAGVSAGEQEAIKAINAVRAAQQGATFHAKTVTLDSAEDSPLPGICAEGKWHAARKMQDR